MHTIIVDDSRAMRMLLSRLVEAIGSEVSQAVDGVDALAVLNGLDEPPALMLIDWNMPGMNGLELVVEVRKRHEWRGITLMMVTTESEHEQIVRALAAGAHEYLIKPFTGDALTEKLEMLGLIPEGAEA
jgi:two-component system chemotaxis response regulator CheY